jgi:chromate reductase, NAD(P)H dehydrogenase (quinone)
MYKIIAIPGSLRANSSSHQILNHFTGLMPSTIELTIFDGVGNLPHFNDPVEIPQAVTDFRDKIKQADAVIICTPEYAFGVPGSLKNALDWTVGTGEFVDKPVALITASSQGEKGHAALLLILGAISAKVVPETALLISFVRAKLNNDGTIKDPQTANDLKRVATSLINSIPKN